MDHDFSAILSISMISFGNSHVDYLSRIISPILPQKVADFDPANENSICHKIISRSDLEKYLEDRNLWAPTHVAHPKFKRLSMWRSFFPNCGLFTPGLLDALYHRLEKERRKPTLLRPEAPAEFREIVEKQQAWAAKEAAVEEEVKVEQEAVKEGEEVVEEEAKVGEEEEVKAGEEVKAEEEEVEVEEAAKEGEEVKVAEGVKVEEEAEVEEGVKVAEGVDEEKVDKFEQLKSSVGTGKTEVPVVSCPPT